MKQVAGWNADGERSQDAGKPLAEVGKFTHGYRLTSAAEIVCESGEWNQICRSRR
jgi:hypothetical protein